MAKPSAEELNRLGVQSLERGEFGLALERFGSAMAADPHNEEYPNNLGMCYLLAGEPAKARDFFEQALGLRETPLYHVNLGVALIRLGNPDGAMQKFKRALEMDGRFFDAWYQMGLLYYSARKFIEARQAWQEAAAIREEPVISSNLGMAEMELGNKDEARTHFLQAIRLNEGYAQAHFNLGVLEQSLGRDRDAARCYETALKIQPENFIPWMNLGIVRERLGEIAGAMEALEAFLRFVPPGMERQIRDARRRLKRRREQNV